MRFKLIFFAIAVFVCAIGVSNSHAGWVGTGYATHIDCKCLATGVTKSFGLPSDTFTQAQLNAACDTEYGATSCTAPVPDASVVINSVDNPTAIPIAKGTATGAGISERGFYWWIPPTSENHFGGAESGLLPEGGSGAGAFSLSLSGLKPMNTYHIKAYIKVGGQLITSDELLFTTGAARVPALITKSDYMICRRDILVKGEITDVGSSPADIYGFVYATHPNPTVFDRALAFAWDTTLPLSQGKAFEGTIKGLVPEKYCFRAYAHNAQGTAYGAEYCFVIDGNIQSSYKYAWNENAGWFNFNSLGGVSVFSDHLEGYVWNENTGWIKLGSFTAGTSHTYSNASNTDYGVNNDGSGNLSGYGWSENVGWINFRSVGGGVFIDLSGNFSGYAWGENIGWIHFANTTPAYKVSSNFMNTSCNMLVVHTNQDVTVNELQASVKGEISDVGSSAIEVYGFVYATHTLPTVYDKALAMFTPATFPGTFSGTITGLLPGKYYLRAYAKNAQGTVYGEEISFTINGPGFTVLPTTGLMTTESGGTATFTVKLNKQPTADVTTDVSSSDTEEGTVSPASLTFTAQNWDKPQTVTVTGVDDTIIDGDQNYTVKLAAAVSDDPFYNNLKPDDVAVVNRDNDGNHAPEADLQTLSTDQDKSLSITLTGRDQDNDNITYSVTADPQHGLLTGSAPDLTYTPTTGFFGADSFTFKTSDGKLYSDDAKIAITVISLNGNHAPKADPQTLSTDQDKALSILLTGSDEDRDAITYSVIANPQHGQLSGTAPNLTYTPASGYSGADSFTFKTYDGKLYSDTAAVAITVKQVAAPVNPPVQYVNYPPTADEQTLITEQDKALKITLTGKDQNGDTLSFAIVKQPANGKITGTAPDMTYTPNPGFYGQDNFTFKANDGVWDSEAAIVRITVNRLNRAPIADEQTLITEQDNALKITLTGSDPDGDPVTYLMVNPPVNGQLTGTAPNLTYTPNKGFSDTDSFTFKVNDGKADSVVATVKITVKKSNQPPKADEQTVTTVKGKDVKITLTGSDPDGDPITYLMVNPPVNGQLTGTAPDLTYKPNAKFSGTDSFTFKTNDGKADSAVATVKITVDAHNAPIIFRCPQTIFLSFSDKELEGRIVISGDDDFNVWHTVVVTDDPKHGKLRFDSRTDRFYENDHRSYYSYDFFYTPTPGYFFTDSFTIVAYDGEKYSSPATITVKLPDEPKSMMKWSSKCYYTREVSCYCPSTGQQLIHALPTDCYESEELCREFFGDCVDHSPKADSKNWETYRDMAVRILLTGSDEDNYIRYFITADPSHGKLSGTPPNLTYTPLPGYTGSDSFMFIVFDGVLYSTATISIEVKQIVGSAPLVISELIGVDRDDQDVKITLTGSDPDGDPLTYQIVSPPAYGQLTGTAPNLTYEATQFSKTDSFTFKANDGKADSNVATVEMIINHPPKAESQDLGEIKQHDNIFITLKGTDADGDKLTYTIVKQPTGILTGSTPTVKYTNNVEKGANDYFTFKVNDGKADSNIATVKIKAAAETKKDDILTSCFIAASADGADSLPSAGIFFALLGLGLAGLLYEKRVK